MTPSGTGSAPTNTHDLSSTCGVPNTSSYYKVIISPKSIIFAYPAEINYLSSFGTFCSSNPQGNPNKSEKEKVFQWSPSGDVGFFLQFGFIPTHLASGQFPGRHVIP